MGSAVRLCWLLCALLLGGWAAPASAQAGSVGEPVPTCLRRAASGVDPLAMLRRPAGFDCRTPQSRFGPGDYLVVSRALPANFGARGPVVVRSFGSWQRRVALYALYADDHVHRDAFDSRGATRRLDLGAMLSIPLPERGTPVVRLLWVVEGAANVRGVVDDARVARAGEAVRSNLLLAAAYSGFAGLCLTLLIYNFALWGALRHRFQLAYCAMAATLLLYAFTSSEALAWAWPGFDNLDRIRINQVLLAAAAVSALAFARSFFEARVFSA